LIDRWPLPKTKVVWVPVTSSSSLGIRPSLW